MRQFKADILLNDAVVLSAASVELWTKNDKIWRGQIVYFGADRLELNQAYTVRTREENRSVTIVDITVVTGFTSALFEENSVARTPGPTARLAARAESPHAGS
jgi:hypothetical protein